jgi:hypothetical protein
MLNFDTKVACCTVFSMIDLGKGYHKISVNPEDVKKTTATSLFGLFQYERMPFGLRRAGVSFQGHVDRAIRDCQVAFALVMKIVICSRTHEEHIGHVRQVLQALQKNWLVIISEKSVKGAPKLDYLATRYPQRACCHSLPMWLPFRGFLAPLSSRSCRHFWGLSTFTGDFCPASPANCVL